MKTLKYILLPILFLTTSCYIYKPYTEKEGMANNDAPVSPAPGSITSMDSYERSKQKVSINPKNEREQQEKERMKSKQEQDKEKDKKENMGSPDKDGRETKNLELNPTKNMNLEGSQKGKQDINSIDSTEPQIVDAGIKGKLQPNKFYKITARDKQFKIQVDKWEGDSLVSHIIRKPQKEVKLHKDEINEELILERRFSKPFSDLFTVGAYAAGAAAVLLIVL